MFTFVVYDSGVNKGKLRTFVSEDAAYEVAKQYDGGVALPITKKKVIHE
tara:strand:- start:84 stop:230 length:147 start_codon:yes stop_codon:yes gene_type:complete